MYIEREGEREVVLVIGSEITVICLYFGLPLLSKSSNTLLNRNGSNNLLLYSPNLMSLYQFSVSVLFCYFLY